MDKYNQWIGVGFKGGGILGIGGVDYMSGTLRNLGLLGEHHDFQIASGRLGLGLGGSVGVIACIVYDCPNLYVLNDTTVDDWSINAAFGPKWDSIVKGLRGYKFFETVLKMYSKAKLVPSDIDNLRNSASYLYTAGDIAMAQKGAPKLVTIDVPAAGVGVELSAYITKGTIEILS